MLAQCSILVNGNGISLNLMLEKLSQHIGRRYKFVSLNEHNWQQCRWKGWNVTVIVWTIINEIKWNSGWSSEFHIYWNNVIAPCSLCFILFYIYLLSSALFPLYSFHLLSSFTPLSRVIHCHSWTSRPLSHVAVILHTAGLEEGRHTHAHTHTENLCDCAHSSYTV